jgi:RHS repeat-associated protein
LGTPIALISEQGEVDWLIMLDPWGDTLREYNPKNLHQPIRFQGQQFDEESGLHYNRHRYYDPKLGRYVTQDPIGLGGDVNSYEYVVQNPVNLADPEGLFPMYKNWGGKNWSGGQSGPTIPANPLPAADAYDVCYMQHDYCYAAAQCQGPTCSSNTPSIKYCDVQLAHCTLAVPSGTGGWWGSIFGPASSIWAIFKGALEE